MIYIYIYVFCGWWVKSQRSTFWYVISIVYNHAHPPRCEIIHTIFIFVWVGVAKSAQLILICHIHQVPPRTRTKIRDHTHYLFFCVWDSCKVSEAHFDMSHPSCTTTHTHPHAKYTLFLFFLVLEGGLQSQCMGWLPLVGSLKSSVSFAEYHLLYRALLQKRPIIVRSLLIVATPYHILIHRRL